MGKLWTAFLGLIGLVVATGAMAQTVPAPAAPTPTADPENILHLDLSTGGRVTIQLRPDKAPAHVERIKTLARQGFYDGLVFHRVIDGFMAQTGDPQGTGQGGSKLPDLKAEFNDLPHLRGTVSMARADDPNSANSQFFICFMPVVRLDGKYTVLGRVTGGMQFVDKIERGEPPANPAKILKASIGADNVPPPVFAAPAPAIAATPATQAEILNAAAEAIDQKAAEATSPTTGEAADAIAANKRVHELANENNLREQPKSTPEAAKQPN